MAAAGDDDKLSKHNKSGDLWLSIQGKVYNVTDWAKRHPGGEKPREKSIPHSTNNGVNRTPQSTRLEESVNHGRNPGHESASVNNVPVAVFRRADGLAGGMNLVTDAFIAFHPGSAWKHLDDLFTGFHLHDFHVSKMSRDYRTLATQFARSGMFEKKGHGVIYSHCFVSFLLAACFYGVLRCDGFLTHILSGCLLGLIWITPATTTS